jgi:hypothetical protein
VRSCELLVTSTSGDEWGQVCGRESVGRCYECAISVCWKHFETCGTCHKRYCSGCLPFHLSEHTKAAQPASAPKMRKSA